MARDGWHTASGYKVFVEDGRVIRGIGPDGRTVYVYRWVRKWGIWNRTSITLDAFNAGMRRGTVTLR